MHHLFYSMFPHFLQLVFYNLIPNDILIKNKIYPSHRGLHKEASQEILHLVHTSTLHL